jgi:membrane-associated phospholipid phosphatase
MNYSRIITFLIVVFTFSLSHAQESTRPFELNFTKEAVIVGVGTAAGITALTILLNMNPLTTEEINSLNPLDVNGFDRTAIGILRDDHLGDALLLGSYLMPLTFFTNKEASKDFGDLAVMYGEVLLINASINGIVKGLTKRVRPYTYDDQSPIEDKAKVNVRRSFYSGHVSISASNSFFTASVLSEYLSDNTAKILIWSVATLYPAIVGFSRVHNHWHFPTDVIVGYIVGAAIGYLIPLIHKNDNSTYTNPTENFYKPLIGFKINF